jgi:hypothetical protein
MSPLGASCSTALAENLAKFESTFGEINVGRPYPGQPSLPAACLAGKTQPEMSSNFNAWK